MIFRLTCCALMGCAVLAGQARGDEWSPVAVWEFGAEEATPLKMHGNVQRDQAGPRPPQFPDFAENNTAVKFDTTGYLSVADTGPNSDFDFNNGDAITLEAWVNVHDARNGHQTYVIGKGRTGEPQFTRDNQNWALRIVSQSDVAKVSFLFATAPGAGDAHWHRWTSHAGFQPASGWHHVAVAYRFGEPDSVRGWIDGQPTAGAWDMGGATSEPPIVDDDAVWIGSSRGGSPSNGFHGLLDAVAVHRTVLTDKMIAARARRVGSLHVIDAQQEVMPELSAVPEGRVLVTFSEGMPAHTRWPNEGEAWPSETARWVGEEFLLPRIPLRYDDWGIRTSWKAPLLVRMAGYVELSPGRHQFLLRARAVSRLWVDGEVIARTETVSRPPNGEEPVTPLVDPPLPGLRLPGYHQQEVFGEREIAEAADGAPRRVPIVLEMIVGGKDLRTETGEICIAVQTDEGTSYSVLRPPGQCELPLTDTAVEPALAKIESSLASYDDQARRQAAASQDAFWLHRHDTARRWAAQQAATEVPFRSGESIHPIDAFVAAKINQAVAEALQFDEQATANFHNHVLSILREHCFRCHGEKDEGGLRLSSRASALRGGESELPAIVPGDSGASELISRVRGGDMPPTDDELSAEQIAVLENWIEDGATWPAPPIADDQVAMPSVVDDASFLRRVYLDTVGVPPTQREAEAFLGSSHPDKRAHLIDQLLSDQRYADHWMSFWLDLLAENPTLLNASLNSTGPFRWFLYDSLHDHKPLDRMVTELILMRGSAHEGGSAGFALAGENDAPLAAKGHILASAFLGIELQCARCHDSPYHSTTQRDLYSLAAMLNRKSMTPPETSRVPDAFFAQKARESLIRVSLKPGDPVAAEWPFAVTTGIDDDTALDPLMHDPQDSRQRLAALITAPGNRRFPRVIVNHIWKRLIGAGLIEPVDDWEGREASHPGLLDWLAEQLITHDYDVRHVIRLIMTSQTYQREAIGRNLEAAAEQRFFNAPERRRLTAEQIVDSLLAATESAMDVEELTFVLDGRHPIDKRLTLGQPSRAWMFASLNNERDRPSLSLPRARAVADVLEAFGWTGSRQKPISERDTDPNLLQPGVLANGTLSMTLTRAAQGSRLAQLALDAESPQRLVEALFLRILTRPPKPEEQAAFSQALAEGFRSRLLPADEIDPVPNHPRLPQVTWSNHLSPESNRIQREMERRVRQGPPPDPRLRPQWREAYEDVVWSLINHREFVWVP